MTETTRDLQHGDQAPRPPAQDETPPPPPTRPYPGLRPFSSDESHLFFGRDEQCDALLERLARSRLVAVVGASGSGKSSLVRAGLIPALHSGYLVRGPREWRVAVFRPGTGPIDALARALVDAKSPDAYARALTPTVARLQLGYSSGGISDVAASIIPPHGGGLLVVVDQFEELFRFRRSAPEPEEAVAFVRLLLTAAQQDGVAIYVVLTMRSDFIGECSRFHGLPEALNDSQFLVPRLTREQTRDAIEGPAAVAGGAIAPRLVQKLLNDVQDDPDRLPVLQHGLMRMWNIAAPERALGEPVDLRHYEDPRVDGLARALDIDAEEAYSQLSAARQAAVRTIFQALTERGVDGREVRRPCTVSTLAAVTGLDAAGVRDTLEPFTTSERSFVTINAPTDAPDRSSDDAAVVDISHESLVRLWQRLRGWVDEEVRSGEIYRDLHKAATRWAAGEGSLYRDPELTTVTRWWQREHPTAAWAERYGDGLDDARAFTRRSQARRAWLRAAFVSLGVCVAGVAVALWLLWSRAERLATEALSRGLAARSELVDAGQSYPSVPGMLLAVEAFRRWPLPEADRILRRGLAADAVRGRTYRLRFDAEDNAPPAVGNRLVALPTEDGTLRVIDLTSGEQRFSVRRAATIEGLLFSPAGDVLAVSRAGGTLQLFDTSTGRALAERQWTRSSVNGLAFSADNRLFVASVAGTLVFFDPRQGMVTTEIPISEPLGTLVFSPDGQSLAAAGNGVAALFTLGAKRAIAQVDGLGGDRNLRFSRDSRWLAVADTDAVRVFETRSGRQQQVFPARDQTVSAEETGGPWFARDNRTLVAQTSAAMLLADVETGAVRTLGAGPILSADVDRQGARLAFQQLDTRNAISNSFSTVANVVELPSGAPLFTKSQLVTRRIGDAAEVPASFVGFSGDGQKLAVQTAAYNSVVDLVEIATGQASTGLSFQNLSDSGRRPAWGVFSRDGKSFAWSWNQSELNVLRMGGWQLRLRRAEPPSLVRFDPTGSTLLVATINAAELLHPRQTPVESQIFHGFQPVSVRAMVSDDGERVVTVGDDAAVHAFDVRTGIERSWQEPAGAQPGRSTATSDLSAFSALIAASGRRALVRRPSLAVEVIDLTTLGNGIPLPDVRIRSSDAISPDGRYLVQPGGSSVTVIDLDSSARRSLSHAERVTAVAFGANPRYLGIAGPQRVRLVDVISGAQLFEANVKGVRRLAVNSDGTSMAAATNDAVLLLPRTGAARTWTDVGQARSLLFSRSDVLLVVGADDSVRLLGAPGGSTGHTFDVPRATSSAFSPDGTLLVVGNAGGEVRVVDSRTGDERLRWNENQPIRALGFGVGEIIVAMGSNNVVSVRRETLSADELIEQACRRVPRNLDRAEWQQYVGQVPYRDTCTPQRR